MFKTTTYSKKDLDEEEEIIDINSQMHLENCQTTKQKKDLFFVNRENPTPSPSPYWPIFKVNGFENSKVSKEDETATTTTTTSSIMEKITHSSNIPQYINDTKTGKIRCIIVNSILEWTAVLGFHRETFHLAVSYFDKYCSMTPVRANETLGLCGIICLNLAAKLVEIYIPSTNDYILLALQNNVKITKEDFNNMEKEILSKITWKLRPTTIYHTLNQLLNKWDNFGILFTVTDFKFLKNNPLSYIHFRQINQIIDTITHCHLYLNFSFEYIVCSSLLILFFRNVGCEFFNEDNKHKFNFDRDFFCSFISSILYDKSNLLYELVSKFQVFLLESKIEILSEKFINALVFSSKFLEIKFYYKKPKMVDRDVKRSYNELLNCQTKIAKLKELFQICYPENKSISLI